MSDQTTTTPAPVFRIVRTGQGMGGFLAPPGHPDHFYEVRGYWPRGNRAVTPSLRREADSYSPLSSVIKDEYGYVPAAVVAWAQRIMDRAQLVCSEAWVRSVYGYFRNSYSPDGTDRNVSNAVSTGPATHHLGYLCVRSYFPDHQPRTDLIADPGNGYGSYPCVKCGKAVQYEARQDAFAEAVPSARNGLNYITECPEGGTHER